MDTSHASHAPAVEIRDLHRRFSTPAGPVTAVDGIDLSIARGEVVALLGPNGAGKTTTLDVVLGLSEPTSGEVEVLGRTPRGAVGEGLVSAVLQTGGLLADLSVRESVEYVRATYDRLPGRCAPTEAVLERTGLTALAGRRVSRCSGGEQQRLRFALALLPDPELLVLDEPTAGMDVTARREFWAVMHAEAERGRTVVFATHYLEEADAFASRIVLVARGRVVADGPTEQIRARATGRVVSALVDDPEAVAHALRGVAADVETQGSRVVARAGDSDAVARLLLTELGGHDLEVTSGSLEDAFVLLTGPEDGSSHRSSVRSPDPSPAHHPETTEATR